MASEKEQNLFDELTAWTLSQRESGFIHQHVVDAWAAQQATEKSKPISVAFALIGLYLLLEEGFSGREVQLVHMRLAQPQGRLAGRKEWPHFPLPKERGRIRVSEVVAASENMRAQAIESWCRSVGEAWEGSHQAVADWVRRDLGDLQKHRLPPKSG